MIKFLDMELINKRFEILFQKEFANFLNSGQYILGNQVVQFEQEFASYCGTSHCIGVSSGLDALQLIFEAYITIGALQTGDEVIVPANTYIASVLAVSHSGLKPIFVEPDLNTYNIDVTKIERAITSKTKAVLGVHLYGQLYDAVTLESICAQHNLLLIEDAAQAHGAVCKDERKAGNLSHAAAFSFYPTKNLGALGDAGAVTTNDAELANVINKLRNYGRESMYSNDLKGHNCRLDELQAAFLRIKLKHLDSDNDKRREIAYKYVSEITNSQIQLPFNNKSEDHVFHQFVIQCEHRDNLQKHLLDNGIETLIHYPIPIHKQLAYKEYKDLSLPIVEHIHKVVLSLPMSPVLSQDDAGQVVQIINSY